MKRSQVDSILDKVHKRASAQAAIRGILPTRTPIKDVNSNGIDDDDEEEYVPVGVGGLIAASAKLLAINRGLDKTDARDALMFKRILTPDRLIGERIKLDAEGIRRSIMNRVSRSKSLSALHPFTFDGYTEKFIVGNPLSSPLEEINPLHLVEQSRRVTQMGPGGIGTDNAITQDMQSIATDQFGFISPTEGPESMPSNDTYVYTKEGWKVWKYVDENTMFACNIGGRLEFHKPTKINTYKFEGDLIRGEHSNILMRVTPHHRVYYTAFTNVNTWDDYKVGFAEDLYGKTIRIPCWHLPYEGKLSHVSHVDIPGMGNVAVEDFCAFMGWYLSEGNITDIDNVNSHIVISQCSLANPDCFAEIEALLPRLNLTFTYGKYGPYKPHKNAARNGFNIGNKLLYNFLHSYIPGGRLCHVKGFPDELLEYSVEARKALLHALLQGDGRLNKTHTTYCTTSLDLALGVEKLMISLGHPCRIRLEPDKRPYVKTMNYAVCLFKTKEKTLTGNTSTHRLYPGRVYGNNWSKEPYAGMVSCATVPGSKLLVRGSPTTQAYWTGNSERVGIDVRLAWGTKIGSDGKPYQKFFDRRAGKQRWMSPEDLDGMTIKVPD